MNHKQVMIKVNAECDEGIAPVVLALNEINGVITLESCQQGRDGEALVYFMYGKNWLDIGYLTHELAACFRENGICCECMLRLEWLGSNDQPHAKMIFDIEYMDRIVNIIHSSVARINHHMSELIRGNVCIGPHN
ncbi:MAG: hypothetical protein M1371_11070 [Actinobacteria bacterium]|nr:hypothetical protein [Actinomycetota bacterium]